MEETPKKCQYRQDRAGDLFGEDRRPANVSKSALGHALQKVPHRERGIAKQADVIRSYEVFVVWHGRRQEGNRLPDCPRGREERGAVVARSLGDDDAVIGIGTV